MDSSVESQLRAALFERLDQIAERRGYVTRAELESLLVDGITYKAIDRNKGIRNPPGFMATLSVLSDPNSEYDDSDLGDSLFSYAYQKGSIHGSNVKMRRALELGLPIIFLRKIADGAFVPVFPVYVVEDDVPNRRFILALDASLKQLVADPLHLKPAERAYAERIAKVRLHQPAFRGTILMAYEHRCTVCTLRHGMLLDAAHIIEDGEAHGAPIVQNGLSLCKIHHAAYDANLLGISPGYVVQINRDLMEEVDGPMLKHGLQEMNNRPLTLPPRKSHRPDRDRLAERFIKFLSAG